MDDLPGTLARLFTDPPYCFLSWAAVAMVVGTLIGIASSAAANALAVVPRTGGGLVGIVTAPFIHTGFAHLFANLPPFLVLGALILRRGDTRFLGVAAAIAVLQGFLLWVLGRRAAHVGMSGVIFGFLGYLLAVAWFTQTSTDVLVALATLAFYGGMLAGIAPARNGTSWEGHLLGLVAGVAGAWVQYRG